MYLPRKLVVLLLLMVMLVMSTCASSAGIREKAILDNYSSEKKNKYEDLLVDIGRYTTAGEAFQKKYHRYLIGIAADVMENKKLTVEKGSIGFYFDKKAGDMSRLYLGLDINTGSDYTDSYGRVAVMLLKRDLQKIIETVNSCKTIFDESEIVGMVIGWKWTSNGAAEQVNIWISEDDVTLLEQNKLTFYELIQRGTITNTTGRIIRLPI